jgi:hypothetical protein
MTGVKGPVTIRRQIGLSLRGSFALSTGKPGTPHHEDTDGALQLGPPILRCAKSVLDSQLRALARHGSALHNFGQAALKRHGSHFTWRRRGVVLFRHFFWACGQ